ncbi:MAG TPA: PhnD/SsuA/transferrin family substrate-binding protein [Gemmataceae bacterium]|nr:PhnD/SsuA/transferrin family substrate-binding protein [Gemmataceae bacterium]
MIRFPRRMSLTCVLAVFVLTEGIQGQPAKKIDVLRIGTSGSLALNASGTKEETALDALKSFIKTETGFDNEIIQQKDYEELLHKLVNGQLHLGVFQGYEFAWVQAENAKLQPLALAVDVYHYRYAYLMIRRDSKIADFNALQGQTISLPQIGQAHLRLYIERLSQSNGKPLNAFFSKIATPDNIEDALDDVVDGVVQAAVVDRVGLEAYRRRKPGRFARLRELAHSQAFPPPLVAYYDEVVDPQTRQRFQEGLLTANNKEKGQRLLNLFKLTGFEVAPSDFSKVLAETRKAYPPPKKATQ